MTETTRVVDTLSEQVLPEAPLLALEHVGERLERAVARTCDRPPTATVVEQGVDRLLQHALLVVDDDLGRLQVEQALQAVVAVDHPPVEVVEVARREPATVELHHGAQVGRDHRHGIEHHAQRRRLAVDEVGDDLQPLDGLESFGSLAVVDDVAQEHDLAVDVVVVQEALDRLGAHAAVEVVAEALAQAAVDVVVGHELLDRQALERREHVVEVLRLARGRLGDALDVALGLTLGGGELRALGTLAFELLQTVFELGQTLLDVVVAIGLELTLLGIELRLDLRQVVVTTFVVDAGDDVGREVDDALEVLGGEDRAGSPGGSERP